MRSLSIDHAFVEYIPEELEEHRLYVSIPFATAVHKCFCGCGREVVTPLSPTDWQLTFDGKTVSLYPSIGNWSLPCRSHYWVRSDRVEWAARWTQEEIDAVRGQDRLAKREYYGEPADTSGAAVPPPGQPTTLWARIKRSLRAGLDAVR